MSPRLAGKSALVTGAGTGIGRTICIRLAEEGAKVVVTSRSADHVEETCDEVERATGVRPSSWQLDVTDREGVERVFGAAAERLGGIDVLSNNAGIDLPHGPSLEQITDEEWETVLRVNVTGIFWTCRAALPAMADGGSIINMASMNSFVAWENNAPYSASKGAVLQFTRALALELAPRGIRVNAVCPGIIDTPMTDAFLERADDPHALRAEYEAVSPMDRMGTAREVANCVLFLASDESSFVNGAPLLVDGATTAR